MLTSGGGGGDLYRKLRGGLNPLRCITQDSEPSTPLTKPFRPQIDDLKTGPPVVYGVEGWVLGLTGKVPVYCD